VSGLTGMVALHWYCGDALTDSVVFVAVVVFALHEPAGPH